MGVGTSSRGVWLAAAIAAILGILFTATQVVERIAILNDPLASLACDVNATISCTNVLSAWQSSVILGVPNAYIGGVMFSMFLATAIAGLTGTVLGRATLGIMLGLAIFFAAFASWFMVQTAFVIGSLCLWCTGIITCVAIIGACLTHEFARTNSEGSRMAILDRSGAAILAWAGWWLAILAVVAIGLD